MGLLPAEAAVDAAQDAEEEEGAAYDGADLDARGARHGVDREAYEDQAGAAAQGVDAGVVALHLALQLYDLVFELLPVEVMGLWIRGLICPWWRAPQVDVIVAGHASHSP